MLRSPDGTHPPAALWTRSAALALVRSAVQVRRAPPCGRPHYTHRHYWFPPVTSESSRTLVLELCVCDSFSRDVVVGSGGVFGGGYSVIFIVHFISLITLDSRGVHTLENLIP